MNNERLKQICDTYKDDILRGDVDQYLMVLAQNIEREVRHECVSLAYDLANNLANLNRGK